MNKARAAEDAAAPVAPNVLNDALAAGRSLSTGVVENTKMNEAQDDTDATVLAASASSAACALFVLSFLQLLCINRRQR